MTSAGPKVVRPKPKLRGISHLIGTIVAIPAVVLCINHASAGRGTLAAAVYGGSVLFLLGASAIYHTPMWQPRARMWLRRVDHTAIFVLIAGTYTPLCLMAMESGGGTLLAIMWSLAGAGAVLSLAWPKAPRWVTVPLYILMGWMVVPYYSEIAAVLTPTSFALILTGGILYTTGALTYARRWPDPAPATFGYHEIFHVFVLAAVGCHYLMVWQLVA